MRSLVTQLTAALRVSNSAQRDYDYDKIVWAALSPARQEACGELWGKYAATKMATRILYHAIQGCLTKQLHAQDRERLGRQQCRKYKTGNAQ